MSEEERLTLHRLQYASQVVFQRILDAMLTPESQIPALQIRANIEPIRQFKKEGPDVGQREEVESKSGQRIN